MRFFFSEGRVNAAILFILLYDLSHSMNCRKEHIKNLASLRVERVKEIEEKERECLCKRKRAETLL